MYADLIQHLARGATVVTSTRRLASSLRRTYALHAHRQGQRTWRAPDVLPWGAWLERTFQAAAIRGRTDGMLVSISQSQALWERLISESPEGRALLGAERVAEIALEAAELMHAWRLGEELKSMPLSEEARAFLRWKRVYDAYCVGEYIIDPARLPDAVRKALLAGPVSLPSQLVLFGFDALTLQQTDVLSTLQQQGVSVLVLSAPEQAAAAVVWRHTSSMDEIRGAAAWARGCLAKSPAASIGIVVPDLTRSRSTIARIFDEVLVPTAMLDPVRVGARPWNVSLGVPLADWPLIHTALSILELVCGPVSIELASALLRSPFVGDAESERTARALLDGRLRRIGDPRLDLDGLLHRAGAEGHTHSCGLLAERLRVLRYRVRELPNQPQSISSWGPALGVLLGAVGWPGERELNSDEYQTLVKWNELIAGLVRLDVVLRPTTLAGAVSVLRAQATRMLFQPESREVPIQVLGLLESAQIEFDHLLVMGLTDAAWPRLAHPNPLLPVPLQRAHGLPGCSAEWELGFARRLQAGWLSAAANVVFSYYHTDGDRTVGPSPLLMGLPTATAEDLEVAPLANWRDTVLTTATMEQIVDWQGRVLPQGMFFRKGVRVLQDQSACAFRAFAVHRLGARALEHPREGLDARVRGTLVHTALAALWSELGAQQQLIDATPSALCALVERCVADALARLGRRPGALFQTRFFGLEQERLTALLFEWLAVERRRASFDVMVTEHEADLTVGGVALRLRMDRVDRLTNGEEVLLDYKTGSVSARAWLGDRPDEPQLLLYALARPIPGALTFAQVRRGECKLNGLSGGAPVGPGVTVLAEQTGVDHVTNWAAQLAAWRETVERLAIAFRCGAAPVDPKRRMQTCRNCDLANLCRVSELTRPDLLEAKVDNAP